MFKLKCAIWCVLVVGVVPVFGANLARASVVSPRRLLEVADIAGPVMSPDGRHVAFRVERALVTRNTYSSVWYVQGLDDPLPQRVGDGGVPLRDSAGESLSPKVVWSPDSHWIYFRASIHGRIQVWRAAANGSGAEPVTHDAADVRKFRLGQGGHVLEYSVGATRAAVRAAERAEYDHGIHIDASVPVGQVLFRSGLVGGRRATQRYGKVWFDRMPLLAGVPGRWKAVNLRTMVSRNLDDTHSDRDHSQVRKRYPEAWIVSPGQHDERVAMLTRYGASDGLLIKPKVRLSAKLPGDGARKLECKAALCTGKAITSIQWRPHSDEVLFTITDPAQGLAQSIYRWNVGSGAVLPVVHAKGLLNGGRRVDTHCGASHDALVCVSAAANQPPRLEHIDLGSGQRRVMFDPNAALARDMAKVSVLLLRWRDAKGQLFTGQFYAATSHLTAKPPLFVDYYRCAGFVRGGLGDEWPFASLAADGISALCINSAPYVVDAVPRFNNGLGAVKSAIKFLSRKGKVDAANVGMGGLSFGSEVTLWVAMRSHLLKAASVSSPLVTPLYYLIGSLKGEDFTKTLHRLWGLESPRQSPARWHALSPVFNLDKIRAPILMQTPEQEYMLALGYEIPLINQHKADLYVFPDEPHQKFQPKHKLAVYQRNLDWFRFWLQGYESPDRTKAEQYARWRSMRSSLREKRH